MKLMIHVLHRGSLRRFTLATSYIGGTSMCYLLMSNPDILAIYTLAGTKDESQWRTVWKRDDLGQITCEGDVIEVVA